MQIKSFYSNKWKEVGDQVEMLEVQSDDDRLTTDSSVEQTSNSAQHETLSDSENLSNESSECQILSAPEALQTSDGSKMDVNTTLVDNETFSAFMIADLKKSNQYHTQSILTANLLDCLLNKFEF